MSSSGDHKPFLCFGFDFGFCFGFSSDLLYPIAKLKLDNAMSGKVRTEQLDDGPTMEVTGNLKGGLGVVFGRSTVLFYSFIFTRQGVRISNRNIKLSIIVNLSFVLLKLIVNSFVKRYTWPQQNLKICITKKKKDKRKTFE